MKNGLYTAIFLLFLSSCVQEAGPNDVMVLQRLEEKRQDYLQDVLLRCKAEAELKAALYVDSLLSEQIQISLNDTIFFPPRPDKPESRGPVILPDFIKPEPIFRDTTMKKEE